MQTVMEILAIIITLGAVMILWIIALPSLKRLVRWIVAFNSSFNKWNKDKVK